ncbi:hypothetical protein D3C72_1492520 [compost metagenome]
MLVRHDQHVLPFVAGQGDEVGVVGQRFGGHADIGLLVDHHAGHFGGRGLVQADGDLGVVFAQLGHGRGQHIAGLRVGGGNRERTAVLRAELVADALQVTHFAHDDLNALEHLQAGLGDALQALAVASEDVDAQLFLQLDDGLGDTGLRGVQRLGGLGQVEVAARGLLHEAELMQVHKRFGLRPAAGCALRTGPTRLWNIDLHHYASLEYKRQ